MPQAVLVDRDEAEAARRERVAEHGFDARAYPRGATAHFAQHKIADFGVLQVVNCELAPLALVDRRQPEARAFLLDHAEHQLGRAFELLERMGNPALPSLLGPREDAVADAERAAPPAFD